MTRFNRKFAAVLIAAASLGVAAIAAGGDASARDRDRGGPSVRDHRSGPSVRDHRTPPTIRDHREPKVTVRDHREPKVTVRDHRTPPTVRDHREPRVTVRDHRDTSNRPGGTTVTSGGRRGR